MCFKNEVSDEAVLGSRSDKATGILKQQALMRAKRVDVDNDHYVAVKQCKACGIAFIVEMHQTELRVVV